MKRTPRVLSTGREQGRFSSKLMIYVSTIIILRKHRLLLLLAFYASNSDGNTKYIRSFNFRWLSQIESKFCQRIYTMSISRDDLVVSKNQKYKNYWRSRRVPEPDLQELYIYTEVSRIIQSFPNGDYRVRA